MNELNTADNVIRIHPDHVPDTCTACSTPLHAVYHPRHFQSQTESPEPRLRGAAKNFGAPFRNRSVVVAQIPVGGFAVFYAADPVSRASVRGSAYNWALSDRVVGVGARMRSEKLCGEHVRIWRVR